MEINRLQTLEKALKKRGLTIQQANEKPLGTDGVDGPTWDYGHVASLYEAISEDLGVSQEHLQRKFANSPADGCWICRRPTNEKRNLFSKVPIQLRERFCILHGDEAKHAIRPPKVKPPNVDFEYEFMLMDWASAHPDLTWLPDIACPKCGKNPFAKGDYLCKECRYG